MANYQDILEAYQNGVMWNTTTDESQVAFLDSRDFKGMWSNEDIANAMRDTISDGKQAQNLEDDALIEMYNLSKGKYTEQPHDPNHAEYDPMFGNSQHFVTNPGPNTFDSAKGFASHLSNVGEDELKQPPGDAQEWGHTIGAHEGTHIDQDGGHGAPGDILRSEIQADRAAMSDTQVKGNEEFISAYNDYRALGAGNGDTTHATSPFIGSAEDSHRPVENMGEWHDAASNFKDTMFEEVAAESSKYDNAEDVEKAFQKNPDAVLDKAETSFRDGAFEDSPKQEEYIEEYIDAHNKRVKDDPDQTDSQTPEQEAPAQEEQPQAAVKHDHGKQMRFRDAEQGPSKDDVTNGTKGKLTDNFKPAAEGKNILEEKPTQKPDPGQENTADMSLA